MPGGFFFKRNFLFDLDGTLVDSTRAHARAYLEALGPSHPALAESFDYVPFAGQPTRQVFAALGMGEPGLTELTARKQQLYRSALDRGEIVLFPGAQDLLAGLRRAGRELFVVTGASRVSAERILKTTGIAKLFSGVIAAEDAAAGKPSPDPYLRAISVFQLVREECVAIEDGESGVRSARAAGLAAMLIHTDLRMDGVPQVRDCGELLRRALE